jgi:hypothetical protein
MTTFRRFGRGFFRVAHVREPITQAWPVVCSLKNFRSAG